MLLYEDLSSNIINAAIEVHRNLGSGFLEKVYENTLSFELRNRGLNVNQQKNIKIYYKSFQVGSYYADLIVEDMIVVELKTVKLLEPIFGLQLLNYLKGVNLPLGLLINFGNSKIQVKRIINNNEVYGKEQDIELRKNNI
jgi:GxxExxY protein